VNSFNTALTVDSSCAETMTASDESSLAPAPVRDEARLLVRQTEIEGRLDALLASEGAGSVLLAEALREACLGRGKRVRPILAMLSAAHFGGEEMRAVDFGCALELIHTASLILDDLPCMDDARMRRGRPAFHRRFGEDAAVLGSVALLNHAYGVIGADSGLDAETRLGLIGLVNQTVGLQGLVAGQLRDLRDLSAVRDEMGLKSLNHQKTGVLFIAAAVGGALIAGAPPEARVRARAFGAQLGFAFQLLDDLQDLTSSLDVLGKDVGQDAGRVTFVNLWGAERVRTAVGGAVEEALDALGDRSSPLARYASALFQKAAHGI
jgi:geranylgeranyl diphosphate synthase type II